MEHHGTFDRKDVSCPVRSHSAVNRGAPLARLRDLPGGRYSPALCGQLFWGLRRALNSFGPAKLHVRIRPVSEAEATHHGTHHDGATMPSFQLTGLSHEQFVPLFALTNEQLLTLGAIRCVATTSFGFPCRISLQDANVGEELLLLPYTHQPAASPYRASGPIFVRRGARQRSTPPGFVPEYVSQRLMSLRGYDADHMMIDAAVCEGEAVAEQLERMFSSAGIAYVHLHNAKRGCYSCLATRVSSESKA